MQASEQHRHNEENQRLERTPEPIEKRSGRNPVDRSSRKIRNASARSRTIGTVGCLILLVLISLSSAFAEEIQAVRAAGTDKAASAVSSTPTPSPKFQIGQFVYLQPTSSRPEGSQLSDYNNAEQILLAWAHMKYIFFGRVNGCEDLSQAAQGEFSVRYGQRFTVLDLMRCDDSHYYQLDRSIAIWVQESNLAAREEELSPDGLYFSSEFVPKERWRRPGDVIETKINGSPVSLSLEDPVIETHIDGKYNVRVYRLILTFAIKNKSDQELIITSTFADLHLAKAKWEAPRPVRIAPHTEGRVSLAAELPTTTSQNLYYEDIVLAVNSRSPNDSGYYLISPDSFFYRLDVKTALQAGITPAPDPSSPLSTATVPPQKAADLSCLKDLEPEPGKVLEISDGNTLRVMIRDLVYTVRYLGVELPEHTSPYWDRSGRASAKNGELVYLKQVQLYRDSKEKDDQGRLLRYVVVGDTFVNYQMIYEGYAVASADSQLVCGSLLKQAQQDSQAARMGMWQPTPAYTPQASASTPGNSPYSQTESGSNGSSDPGSGIDTGTETYPSGVTAICNDGTYSYAQHRRGACSWHGGVRLWLVWVAP